MANWFCSMFDVVVCRKRLSSPRCRSELIDSSWVVIVPWQKMHKNKNIKKMNKNCIKNNRCVGIDAPFNEYDDILSCMKHKYCTSNT